MSDDGQAAPGGKGWRAGETFFEEAGGQPAEAVGDRDQRSGAGGADLPASEAGTGLIPEDEGGASDVHLPASEADSEAFAEDDRGETQSWPGRGGPGTFPPPG